MFIAEKNRVMTGILLVSVMLAAAIGNAIDPFNIIRILINLLSKMQGG